MLKKLILVGAMSISLVGCGGGDSSNHSEITRKPMNNTLSGQNTGFKASGSKDRRASIRLIKHGSLNSDNFINGEIKIKDRSEIQFDTLPDELKNSAFLYKIEAEGDVFSQFDVVEFNFQLKSVQEPPGPLKIYQVDIQGRATIYKPINGIESECEKVVENGIEYFAVELTAPISEQGYYIIVFAVTGSTGE